MLGQRIALPGDLAKRPGQVLLAGKGNGMHKHIKAAPLVTKCPEQPFDLGAVLHITGDERHRLVTLERCGQFFDILLHALVRHVSKGELCALTVQSLGNAPGNRSLVRDTHDQAFLAVHQSHEVVLLLWRPEAGGRDAVSDAMLTDAESGCTLPSLAVSLPAVPTTLRWIR